MRREDPREKGAGDEAGRPLGEGGGG